MALSSTKKNILITFAALILVNVIYFLPVFTGKSIAQDDIMMGEAKQKELQDYREEKGEEALWTNSMFSGMPAFQLSVAFHNNIYLYFQKAITYGLGSSSSVYIIATLLLAFHAFLLSFKIRPWLSFIGAVMFAFSGFFIISFAAGHNLKVLVAGFSVAILMGITMAFRGKRWLGALITAFFTGWSVYANHYQITYYFIFVIIAIGIAYLVDAIKKKTLTEFAKTATVLVIAAIVGAAPNFGNLWSTLVYTQETMRGGGSELSTKENKAGLEFDYAMSWSYSPTETLGLFVPQLMGGGAKENYEGTEVFEFLSSNLQRQGLPKDRVEETANQYAGSILYWGEQSLVNGAYYVGAPLLFFFVLGLFFIKGPTKWWVVGSVIFSLLLAWGYHFESFNRFMFEHMPLFNKFRVPSMSLVICFALIPFFGILALDKFLKADLTLDKKKKILLNTLYFTAGPVLLLALLGTALFSFEGLRDPQMAQQGFDLEMIENTRKSLFRTSAFKSFFLIAAMFGICWLYINQKLKYSYMVIGIGVLMIGDLMFFDRDQLGKEEFITSKDYKSQYAPSPADQRILQDTDIHYRVYNTQASLTSDSYTSYYHKSIGGYHGAKLQRYQDLIDRQLSQGNMSVFNMLNTKWIIQKGQNGGEQAVQNPGALGNAWFVQDFKIVPSADEEIDALSDFKPSSTAIIHQEFTDYLVGIEPAQPASSIKLTSYDPKKLVYEANVISNTSLAVFSEIYYKPKYQQWNAYIDGEKVDHIRVNYILRALKIPPGKHSIEFRFEPQTYLMGEKINLVASIILLLGMGIVIYFTLRSRGQRSQSTN